MGGEQKAAAAMAAAGPSSGTGRGRRTSAPLTALEALRAGRALLEDSAHWCKSAPARKAGRPRMPAGDPCPATDRAAVRWCAAGALCKVSGGRRGVPGFLELNQAAHALFGEGIGRLNDRRETTHAMILRCFDQAIAELERKRPSAGRAVVPRGMPLARAPVE